MAKKITAKKTENREFLVLAAVSIVIVAAIFVTSISGSDTPSGYSVLDPTGTWTCVYDSGFHWKHDATGYTIGKYISEETINCQDGQLFCVSGNDCDVAIEGASCECRVAISTVENIR